jgi:hypothetical protein
MRGMGDKTEAAEEGFAPSEHPGPLRPGTVVSTMRRIIPSLAAGVALAAAIPVLGGASDHLPVPTESEYRVPADMVEHTVTLQVVAGSHEVTRSLRSELWLARDRGRQLVTDATTGSVIAETVATSGEIRTFEPERNTITIESQRTLPFASAAYEAAAQRAGLESERTHKVGERTVRGRHALVLRSREGTVTVVDAETYELYERRTMLPGTVQTETRTTDLLPAGSPRARLTMGPHPGAKVVRTK